MPSGSGPITLWQTAERPGATSRGAAERLVEVLDQPERAIRSGDGGIAILLTAGEGTDGVHVLRDDDRLVVHLGQK